MGARIRFIQNVWRKARDYVRYDLKEIVLPSSLPDPPGTEIVHKKIPLKTHLQVWKRAFYIYGRSWKMSMGLIRPNEVLGPKPKSEQSVDASKEEPHEPTIVEELAAAAKAGGEGLRPALQKLYVSRARGYRDALQSFVGGYQEGLKEAMQKAAQDDAVWKSERSGVEKEKEGNEERGGGVGAGKG